MMGYVSHETTVNSSANRRIPQSASSRGAVMIIDAGGGTVDLSSYSFTSMAPISASEDAAPGCECVTHRVCF